MRYLIISILVLAASCGRLSDEERKKLREGMEQNKIVKVTDEEIVATALDEGRFIFSVLEKRKFNQSTIDSLVKNRSVRIHFTKPGDRDAEAIEQQLIDAYIASIVTGDLQDNVQKLYRQNEPAIYDSIVYSKPIVTPMPDGAENLEGVWNVYLAKKNLVIAASKRK